MERLPRAKKIKFLLRTRRDGKKTLSRIPQYSVVHTNPKQKTCTTARKYITSNKITAPAVITVIKPSLIEDKFFLSQIGLWDYKYAVMNYKHFLPEILPVAS
ncbi:DUF3155 domain-containing protein [Iningainema tapete]|uniref:DUF3155 domain-containing protein n=1 Tax=Iningainema tapete BLCC-T55 TaxID=2748662 RepID=A0A8J7BX32_9CYAN|nr:DUF3155 domain-containing protein [Iningainema tapete]MBD2772143.1 DUF3155 domain-containing protein [Iningainema tapete BLCC-T55]